MNIHNGMLWEIKQNNDMKHFDILVLIEKETFV